MLPKTPHHKVSEDLHPNLAKDGPARTDEPQRVAMAVWAPEDGLPDSFARFRSNARIGAENRTMSGAMIGNCALHAPNKNHHAI